MYIQTVHTFFSSMCNCDHKTKQNTDTDVGRRGFHNASRKVSGSIPQRPQPNPLASLSMWPIRATYANVSEVTVGRLHLLNDYLSDSIGFSESIINIHKQYEMLMEMECILQHVLRCRRSLVYPH